jgi:hypothetical protein
MASEGRPFLTRSTQGFGNAVRASKVSVEVADPSRDPSEKSLNNQLNQLVIDVSGAGPHF